MISFLVAIVATSMAVVKAQDKNAQNGVIPAYEPEDLPGAIEEGLRGKGVGGARPNESLQGG